MKFPETLRVQSEHKAFKSEVGDPFGLFMVPKEIAPHNRVLRIVATDGFRTGWNHVSVSLETPTKTPSWDEMVFVKNLFWEPEECVVQFHPPKSKYVDIHPGVLHLWKCVNGKFPMPPIECV